jgi:hypothetical protein
MSMLIRTKIFFSFLCTAVLLTAPVPPAAARSGPLDEALAPGRWLKEVKHQISAQLCRAAARRSEARLGLPPGLLLAIGRVESARVDVQTRQLEPWPWTVQAMGEGLYFETKAEAIKWVEDAQARGITSIDTGCLQVNLFFHPHAFETLDDAFDPQRNADYAGRFLRQLYLETRDWRQATGLYHSRTSSIAAPYQEKVTNALRDFDRSPLSPRQPSIVGKLAQAWHNTLPVSNPPGLQMLNKWSTPSLMPRKFLTNLARPYAEHKGYNL